MRNKSTARPQKGIRLDKKVFNIAFQTYSAVTELYRLPGNVLSNANRKKIMNGQLLTYPCALARTS